MRFLPLVLLSLVACAPSDPAPQLETPADSLAMAVIDAHGGWEAWTTLPTLRFDWAVIRDSAEVVRVRHLWDRTAQRARVEWETGEDSTAVSILDLATSTPDSPVGEAWLNGEPAPPADSLVSAAYARFINDSYWMIAPFKTFDPGVRRGLEPDSASGDVKVLTLDFGDVGMTPGDRYWLFVRPDGTLERWTYVLEGSSSASTWAWSDPADVDGPNGTVTVLTRKSRPDGTAIITEPGTAPGPEAWTSPSPVLQ
ncbi:MAG: hypothetical protein AAGI52_11215 [Bacteroidota bacterium]